MIENRKRFLRASARKQVLVLLLLFDFIDTNIKDP